MHHASYSTSSTGPEPGRGKQALETAARDDHRPYPLDSEPRRRRHLLRLESYTANFATQSTPFATGWNPDTREKAECIPAEANSVGDADDPKDQIARATSRSAGHDSGRPARVLRAARVEGYLSLSRNLKSRGNLRGRGVRYRHFRVLICLPPLVHVYFASTSLANAPAQLCLGSVTQRGRRHHSLGACSRIKPRPPYPFTVASTTARQ